MSIDDEFGPAYPWITFYATYNQLFEQTPEEFIQSHYKPLFREARRRGINKTSL